jgi:ribosome-binding factor A
MFSSGKFRPGQKLAGATKMGKASDRRLAQVSSLLLRTLAELIREELKDPRLGLVSLTEVRLAKDLTTAAIKVSTLGDQTQIEATCAVLNRAAPLLWNRLRFETDLRTVPKLRFEPDMGVVYLEEIDRVLRTLPPSSDADTQLVLLDGEVAPTPAGGGGPLNDDGEEEQE